MSHDMCGNRVTDADGTELECMRSAGHWTRGVEAHCDVSEGRSWVFVYGRPRIWDGDGPWPGLQGEWRDGTTAVD